MHNLQITKTPINGVIVINFDRFSDQRGYFTEISNVKDLSFIKDYNVVQINESMSVPNVVRGLHFQWSPYIGKMVRVIDGSIYDMAVDIRKESPTFGKGVIKHLKRAYESKTDQLFWLPPGIAHGFFCLERAVIEYSCTGEWSPTTESSISPFSEDIDWSLADSSYVELLHNVKEKAVMADKDRNGQTVKMWSENENSNLFLYKDLEMIYEQ